MPELVEGLRYFMQRTLIKDTPQKIGETVLIQGWVHRRRNLGKMIFFDLRDRSGQLQAMVHPNDIGEEGMVLAKELRPEFCVGITGVVQKRNEKNANPDMPTGSVELVGKSVVVYSASETPPFEIENEDRQANEELRLKYRYLDLRHERMARNLKLRDQVITFFREWLHARDFTEVETPILTRGTPEGAREYLVPSRIYKGKFFVLPQAPQQFKQLLMVAGLERYFQIARCFRDEDQRGDRQPEFTQLDMEMSFVEREDVISLIEEMMIAVVKTVTPEKRIQQIPFPRFSYKEAMEKYGTDKPDLREDKNDPNLLAFCWVIDFPFFEKTDPSADGGGWTFTHNPFSAPKPEHMDWFMNKKNIGEILTTQYDIVLNGYEVGGGSIRNHRPEALRKVFEIMGFSEEQITSQFGHMLEAFNYGAPPHGGIAPGIDRLVMILANEPNIREVMAFPKTGDARDPMMGAPSEVTPEQLKELGIRII